MNMLSVLCSTWKQLIASRQGYHELRANYPDVLATYARNASFKWSSSQDPLYLCAQDFRLIDAKRKLARWFVRIPIRKGVAVFAPLRMSKRDEDELANLKVHDSKLVERKGQFCLHLSVSKEVAVGSAHSVLSVDLGERFLATTVLLANGHEASPRFYGKKVRGVRRHYAWLRKRLGERKRLKKIKEMKDREHRVVQWHLHNISKQIVDEAKVNNAAILLGNLEGIGKKNRGRRLNRIVAYMPFYALSQMIEYKASWEGVRVIRTDEAYSSRTCHFCNSEGRRLSQGRFVCSACGHEYNADYNGAFNLGKRFFGYTLKNGATGSWPVSLPFLTEQTSQAAKT